MHHFPFLHYFVNEGQLNVLFFCCFFTLVHMEFHLYEKAQGCTIKLCLSELTRKDNLLSLLPQFIWQIIHPAELTQLKYQTWIAFCNIIFDFCIILKLICKYFIVLYYCCLYAIYVIKQSKYNNVVFLLFLQKHFFCLQLLINFTTITLHVMLYVNVLFHLARRKEVRKRCSAYSVVNSVSRMKW